MNTPRTNLRVCPVCERVSTDGGWFKDMSKDLLAYHKRVRPKCISKAYCETHRKDVAEAICH